MSYHDFITLVSSILGSGGLLGAVYLLMKFRPEAGSIVVKSAEGVLVMQSAYIKKLEARIEHLEQEAKKNSFKIEELTKALDLATERILLFQVSQDRHDVEIKDLRK